MRSSFDVGSHTRLLSWSSLLIVLAALTSCGGGTSDTRPAPAPAPTLQLATAHFIFEYTAIDSASINAIASAVEAEYPRILSDLGVDSMPTVTVRYFVDHAALEAAALPVVVPAWSSGTIRSEALILLMSPNLSGSVSVDSNVTHEFAHCVSWHLNSRFPNNPRWLWESIALLESRQFVNPRNVLYMVAHQPPSLDQLNSFDNTMVYDVGYTIGEFIVQGWGQTALHALILSNGDTAATLGVSPGDFHSAWAQYVYSTYGL